MWPHPRVGPLDHAATWWHLKGMRPMLWKLFLSFSKANLLGYGGGPSVIPLIRADVVNTHKWLTDAEFADTLAVGNSLPGPIATKMAAYIGFKIGGYGGATVALLGTVVPTAVLMVLLAGLLFKYKDSTIVKGMIRGAKPVVWVLFLLLVIEYLPFVRPDKAGWVPALFAVGAFVAAYHFKLNQAAIIGTGIVLGGLLLR